MHPMDASPLTPAPLPSPCIPGTPCSAWEQKPTETLRATRGRASCLACRQERCRPLSCSATLKARSCLHSGDLAAHVACRSGNTALPGRADRGTGGVMRLACSYACLLFCTAAGPTRAARHGFPVLRLLQACAQAAGWTSPGWDCGKCAGDPDAPACSAEGMVLQNKCLLQVRGGPAQVCG